MARKSDRIGEDLSAQAGWMFADLLLALAVIFLATISFVPSKDAIPTNILNQAATDGRTVVNKNSIALKSFDERTILMAMQKYAADNHLPADYRITSVTVVGGYDSKTETPDRGTQTALQYAAGIASLNLPQFKNTSTILASSSSVGPGQAVLNLTISSSSVTTK